MAVYCNILFCFDKQFVCNFRYSWYQFIQKWRG